MNLERILDDTQELLILWVPIRWKLYKNIFIFLEMHLTVQVKQSDASDLLKCISKKKSKTDIVKSWEFYQSKSNQEEEN